MVTRPWQNLLSKIWAKWVARRKKQFCKQNGQPILAKKAKWAKNELWLSGSWISLAGNFLLHVQNGPMLSITFCYSREFFDFIVLYCSAAVSFESLLWTLCYVTIQPQILCLNFNFSGKLCSKMSERGSKMEQNGWQREQNGCIYQAKKQSKIGRKKSKFCQGLISMHDIAMHVI